MFHNPCISYIFQTLYPVESEVEGLLLFGKIWRGKNSCLIGLAPLLAPANLTVAHLRTDSLILIRLRLTLGSDYPNPGDNPDIPPYFS